MVQWEYKVGPLTVNFRVLLEPKGFLRIVVLIIALLAFSITAGFNSGSQSNSLSCLGNVEIMNTTNATQTNFTAYLIFSYPYFPGNLRFTVAPGNAISTEGNCGGNFRSLPMSTSAQFFVAMGVLTMLYVIGALLIYMFFITPKLFLAKWLVIGDFFLTIAFGVLYLLACIAWSAGTAQLNGYLTDRLEQYGLDCLRCSRSGVSGATSIQTFAQPAISLIFGYLASFVWLSSSWFVYKDTMWHKDKTGPLSTIYNITGKSKSEEGKDEESKGDP